MKLTFVKILFLATLLFALCYDLSAQVDGGGGPLVTIDFEPVCDDGTTAFHILQFVVGESAPNSLGYVDGQGNAYTPTGTPEAGPCAGTVAAAPDYTMAVTALCDSGTPFYRVAVFTDNTLTPTATADYELDLSTAYTPAGTVYDGPCFTSATATITRVVATGAGSVPAGTASYSICNEGTADASVTIGGGSATTLIPGSCISFAATVDPVSRQRRIAPAVTYDATGTELSILYEQ